MNEGQAVLSVLVYWLLFVIEPGRGARQLSGGYSGFDDQHNAIIYGAEPKGGLWGTAIDLDTGRSDFDASMNGYAYRYMKKKVGTASFDPISHHVLLEVYPNHHGGQLVYGPICANASREPAALFNLGNKHLMPIHDRGWDCSQCVASTFALYSSRIYFILVGNFTDEDGSTYKKAQLRVLFSCVDCVKYFSRNKETFNHTSIISCSKFIADVFSEDITGEVASDLVVKGAKGMKVVRARDEISVFFQLFVMRKKAEPSLVEMNLYHVTASNGHVTLLRRELVPIQYAQWDIKAIGSVDYKLGVLCWTNGDRLYCGDYKSRRLSNVAMLLFPAEAASVQVCAGDMPSLLAFVTGVAIAEVGDKRHIFFGCYPQWPKLGGTGLIQTERDWSNKKIFKLRAGNSRILGGSLIHIAELHDDCSFEPKPIFCPKMPDVRSILHIRDASELGIIASEEVQGSGTMTHPMLCTIVMTCVFASGYL